jgi:type II secretory pathway component PulF
LEDEDRPLPAGGIDSSQLAKLATELEILLRAGSPLGQGLRDAARRWRGPLRPAAEKLALRLDSGLPVDEALRTSPELPPVFRSLVAAGLGTNRAADILHAYASSTRQLLDLRERLARGLMYPTIILIMAYGLSILLIAVVLPEMARMVADVSAAPPWWAASVDHARQTLPIWSWAIPLGIIVAIGLFHLFIGRNMSAIGWWGSLPIARRVLNDIHTSTASRLLAALLDCEVPLPLALSLSAESLARRRARNAVEAIADDLRGGLPTPQAFHRRAGAPPLWRELFARETHPAAIQAGLIHVADALADRARGRAEFLGRVVPVVLIILIGGLTVAAYATAVFAPLIEIWDRMGGQQ